MLLRKFASITEEGASNSVPLLTRMDRQLMDKGRGTFDAFRPEMPVFQLEAEDAHGACSIEGHVIHARTDMLFHRHFAYLGRTPERIALLDQAGGSGSQHIGDEVFFLDENFTHLHRLMLSD